ncbi:hypothetical protein B0T16DRAFT_421269 [Cercophora newfieldiana]|uniref:Uncharacterized protein n=1 Tax=Cercophora newfieldiana TaxID=92897 RepID=A0AA39XRL1_9PEZI|nr:hypothetical protein B0T16DRAFT_421269 [Cercophora newfieldiana]
MSGYGKFLSAAQEVKHDAPAPTAAPVLVRDAEARKRQATTSSTTTFTVTKAPDSTCGFLSGSPGAAITCENKKPCVWESQYVGAIFCGFEDTDPSYLRCFEREAALNPSSCNDVCQTNSFNLLCTDTASPYCRTYAYPGGVRDFRCAVTPVTAPQSVLHTYTNQDDRTLTVSQLGGTIIGFIPSAAGGTTNTRTTRTPTASITDPTDPTNPTGRGGVTSITVTPTPTPGDGGSSSPPIGAIVGGVVGGLAVIGLLILGAFFLIRRNKKNQDLNTSQQPGAPGAPQYPYGGAPPPMQQQYGNVAPSESLGPVSPTSTYDPVFKGHGSVSMASALAPGQDDYNRMSYAPPVYQQGGSPPPQSQPSPPVGYQQPQQGYPQGTPSPPMGYQQPAGAPGYGMPPQGYGPPAGQHVHEIGTVPDQPRGQIHEVS